MPTSPRQRAREKVKADAAAGVRRRKERATATSRERIWGHWSIRAGRCKTLTSKRKPAGKIVASASLTCLLGAGWGRGAYCVCVF